MKLSISRNVLNHLTTVLAQTGSTYTVEMIDKGLTNPEHNEKGFFSDILFFKNIKEKASKTVTITKTETEVTVAVNEELVKDVISLAGTYYQRLAKHLVGMAVELKAFEKDVGTFQDKWKEEKEEKEVPKNTSQTSQPQQTTDKDEVSFDFVEDDKKKEEAHETLRAVLNRQKATQSFEVEFETTDFQFIINTSLDIVHIIPRQGLGKGVTITSEAIKSRSNRGLELLAEELNLPVRALKQLKAKLHEI